MLNQKDFLNKYNYPATHLDDLGIPWEVFESIHDDCWNIQQHLEQHSENIVRQLVRVKEVHSLRSRIKDPEHLVNKLIRKRKENRLFRVDRATWQKGITDLIGVRALHLFKEEWEGIHDFITTTWSFTEKPTANVRNGDSKDIIKQFKERGCKIKNHHRGYRSVHYLVKIGDKRKQTVAEIQVRTLIEEAWSEIDHVVRYPDELNLDLLNGYLDTFNILAGTADNMGSYVKRLKKGLQDNAQANWNEADALAQEYAQEVDTLNVAPDKKEELKKYYADKLLMLSRRVHPIGGHSLITATQILSELDKQLAPERCPACGKVKPSGRGALCPVCRAKLEPGGIRAQ